MAKLTAMLEPITPERCTIRPISAAQLRWCLHLITSAQNRSLRSSMKRLGWRTAPDYSYNLHFPGTILKIAENLSEFG